MKLSNEIMENNRNIVWIASYPKSGNTWFRVFLSNLLSSTKNPININELDRTPIASSRYLFDKYSGIDSSDLTFDEINRFRPEVYRQISDESGDVVFLKVHDSWSLNCENRPLFPKEITKAVIYIVRNPLDVAVSLSHHNGKEIESTIRIMNDINYNLCSNTRKLNNQLHQHLSSWSNHVSSWIEKSNLPVYIIRYEDMIDKPLEVFMKAIGFLDMKYSQEAIAIAIQNSSFKKLRQQEENDGFVERSSKSEYFFRKGIVGDWKQSLSKSQASSLIRENFMMMKKIGYLSD